MAKRLYRSMKTAHDGLPESGRSARMLGVRPGIDIPVAVDGTVAGGFGGMSVAPDSPMHLPAHRRPPEHGGTGKDPIWQLDVEALGDDLVYREDPQLSGEHGFIEPAGPMTLQQYESALFTTRDAWRLP